MALDGEISFRLRVIYHHFRSDAINTIDNWLMTEVYCRFSVSNGDVYSPENKSNADIFYRKWAKAQNGHSAYQIEHAALNRHAPGIRGCRWRNIAYHDISWSGVSILID